MTDLERLLAALGSPIRCLSLDALIRTTCAAGRPRDFEALAELEALRDQPDGG